MGKHVATTTDRTIVSWLTPERRRALYGAVAAILGALAAVGVITGEQSDAWAQVAEQALAVIALVLAALHTGGTYTAPVIDTAETAEATTDTTAGAPGGLDAVITAALTDTDEGGDTGAEV